LGAFVERVTEQSTPFFTFYKDEIIYISDQKLHMIDLYKKTKREISLPDFPYQFVLMENNLIFLVRNQTVDIFKVN